MLYSVQLDFMFSIYVYFHSFEIILPVKDIIFSFKRTNNSAVVDILTRKY